MSVLWRIAQHRVLCVMVSLGLTAMLMWFAKDARPQFDIEGFLPVDGDIAQNFEAMEAIFGRDDQRGFIIVESSEPIEGEVLDRLAALSEALSSLKSVDEVLSGANAELVVEHEDQLATASLKSASASLRHALMQELKKEPFARVFFSSDLKRAAIGISMRSKSPGAKDREAMLQEVERFIDEQGPLFGFDYRVAGYPLHRAMLTREVISDIKKTTPVLAIAFLFSLLIILRRPSFVMLTLVGVLLSLIWTAGFSELLHIQLNVLAQSVMVVVVVVATSDCVHFMSYYAEASGTRKERMKRTFFELATPCFITSLTTATGFMGLYFSALPTVQDFGILVAVGVMCAFFITLFFVLPLLSVSVAQAPLTGSKKLDAAFEHLRLFSQRRAKPIVAAALLLTLLGGLSVAFLKSNSGFLADVRQDHPIHETNTIMEDHFRGVISIDLLIDTKRVSPNDGDLESLTSLTTALRALPSIQSASALSDLLDRFEDKFNAKEKLSKSALLASGLLFVPETLSAFFNEQSGVMRVRATMVNGTSQEAMQAFKDIEALAQKHFPKAQTRLTGQGFLSQWVNATLVEQFSTGFLVAIICVLLLLALFLRGARWALYSLLPNFLPLSLIIGVMVLAGVDLRIGSALALVVVFGLVVDDTIHFIVSYQRSRSLVHTYRSAGKGIFYTSLILIASFGTLLFSDFQVNMILGLLMSVAAILALASDLLVLPALLALFEKEDA